jgi:hypothetical protein
MFQPHSVHGYIYFMICYYRLEITTDPSILVEAIYYPHGLWEIQGMLWSCISRLITNPAIVSKTVILLELEPTAKFPLIKLQLHTEFSSFSSE